MSEARASGAGRPDTPPNQPPPTPPAVRLEPDSSSPDSTSDYSTLFHRAPVGLGVASLDGTLLAFNDAMLDLGGYSREDIVRLGNVAALYADVADRNRVLALAGERGYVWREPVQFRHKDGTPYDTLLSLTPVQFAGERCWYAVVEDVAERRALETQLRQAQKMEEIGRLAGGIAHDFNNLLSVILLYSQAALRNLDTGKQIDRSDLASIEEAARSAAAMTAQLLGFTRQADLAPVPTDLARVVQGVAPMLRRALSDEVEVHVDAARPVAAARVDPRAVEQMLLNLATNARDAMPDGGAIHIAVEDVTLDPGFVTAHPGSTRGPHVCLTLSDGGVGMDEETRRRAFEPFFTTKPSGKGTGLGLPMVYGLTKQQHGFVDLSSTPGSGTTVRLYFPAVSETPQPAPTRISQDALRGGSETILLVEDDAPLRDSARRVLSAFGYTVLTAEDGAAALKAYRAHDGRVDLVISDLVMPRMSGPELYETLRREAGPVRFLLVSGYGGRYQKARGAFGQTIRFLQKPWQLNDLLTAVRRTLDD